MSWYAFASYPSCKFLEVIDSSLIATSNSVGDANRLNPTCADVRTSKDVSECPSSYLLSKKVIVSNLEFHRPFLCFFNRLVAQRKVRPRLKKGGFQK